ncbi:hypothetical protein LSTR_LSTR000938 [Laodelphax striatellus]|uniref:Uncharacterized protein n=1 Tax=Laodelphax striatellus TaxID=195883 RepID=A0A482X0N4_LAOST|nr:hypothetical protein LSTR_LSTR000938 [Laodelphax striatellus]
MQTYADNGERELLFETYHLITRSDTCLQNRESLPVKPVAKCTNTDRHCGPIHIMNVAKILSSSALTVLIAVIEEDRSNRILSLNMALLRLSKNQ